MDYKELAPIVQRAFQKGLDMSKNPKKGGPVNATLSLRNSIKAAPINSGIEVSMNNYGLFINEGTRRSKYAGSVSKGRGGQSEMITSILAWISAKNIQPRFGTKLGLAFAIRNSVWSNGIKPNHWIDNVLDEMLNENSETYKYISQMAIDDIENEIIKLFETLEGI